MYINKYCFNKILGEKHENFNYKDVGKEIGWNFSKMNYSVEYLG